MPLIVMLKTEKGADDGFTVKEYLANQEYEVGADLARCFIEGGAARLLRKKMDESAVEDKMLHEAPENKDDSKGKRRR